MYDACTKQPIDTPEFDYDSGRHNPAAYVRNKGTLTVRTKWRVLSGSISQAFVSATGSLGGFPPILVTFVNGESDWISMTTQEPLPDSIATTLVTWQWEHEINSSGKQPGLQTQHEIYSVNKTPLTNPVYLDLVKWTTAWCSAVSDTADDKAIADSILNGFASTGVIKYGAAGWDTAEILCTGDGMCGGMVQVFYDACGSQGVHVAQSCFVLWDAALLSPEFKWKSMLIYSPGLGRSEPTYPEQTIKQVDSAYPCPKYLDDSSTADDVECENHKAYEFFAPIDGHCINFLNYENQLYLYDLSFGTGPWEGTFSTLPAGIKQGMDLYGFRENYMNKAIDYMRGTVNYKNNSFRGKCYYHKTGNNLDIKPSIIPYDDKEFKYYWNTTN